MVKFKKDGGGFSGMGGASFADVVVLERTHAAGSDLSGELGSHSGLRLVLEGSVIGPESQTLGPSGLVFSPTRDSQWARAGLDGARCVHVQLGVGFVERIAPPGGVPSRGLWVRRHRANWLATRLLVELRNPEPSHVAIEQVLREVLEAILELTTRGDQAAAAAGPEWLARVFDCLHADFRVPPTMVELGRVAGVHPVHLARVFRAREGCTVAEYVRRLRVEWACASLVTGQSLSRVALDAGFTDQSHFTRRFKEVTGWTPGAWRRRVSA